MLCSADVARKDVIVTAKNGRPSTFVVAHRSPEHRIGLPKCFASSAPVCRMRNAPKRDDRCRVNVRRFGLPARRRAARDGCNQYGCFKKTPLRSEKHRNSATCKARVCAPKRNDRIVNGGSNGDVRPMDREWSADAMTLGTVKRVYGYVALRGGFRPGS